MNNWTRRQAAAAILAAGVLPLARLNASVPTSSPPLWLAKGKAGSAFLFGQVPPQATSAWDTKTVLEAFDKSSALWLENPVFTPEEARAQREADAAKSRPTASQYLPASDLQRLHRVLADAGSKPEALDAVAADDVYQILSAAQDTRSGADFSRLPEQIFRAKAQGRSMPIFTEWSSLKEVASFIPAAPDPIRLELIRMGLDNLERARGDDLLAAWLAGDAGYFDRIGMENTARYPELIALMSHKRNSRMADRLMAAMEQPGTHFVCVGMQHVSEPGSIQSFMRAAGVPIERVIT